MSPSTHRRQHTAANIPAPNPTCPYSDSRPPAPPAILHHDVPPLSPTAPITNTVLSPWHFFASSASLRCTLSCTELS
ncbi:uncharacterized protein L3040_006285 [Drepanopeziza brunnea f. sp. 'multigermtubi']|uniref:uncharacterized protein n=1 Tax=Drepanopeziza brunnea f. sp. 'multigermtubi' TaxID=698441 RepID=UPI0023882E1B|nr:hypothetical protein L3040_006285 [Drepanopeziza brunnea f. sp. 'multigermtubi']